MTNVKSPGTFEGSRDVKTRAQRLIPAGCHTYSKGEDQFPYNAPGFIDRAEGCYAYDVDGNRYLDWGMGLRTVVLGHCYPAVLEAVRAQLEKGSNFTLPSPLEAELAEMLVGLIPSAEMVKFAKNGSDVTSAAVRLARAYTGRDYVALCEPGSFFSVNDWYIGSTACGSGVPGAVQQLTLGFKYNDLPGLQALFDQHQNQIAAVVLEPATIDPPAPSYLEGIRELTRKNGAVLIFDEMITGFRWHLQGAQTYYNVTPDLSTFGKALGNGFSISALAGQREIMELGGLHHDKERVFLLSLTHGGETHSIAAAMATVQEFSDKDVVGHIWRVGERLQEGFNGISHELGLGDFVTMVGYPCSPAILCRDGDSKASAELRTLFLQEMIAQGVLIPYIVPSFSHTELEVEATLDAARNALGVYKEALERGTEGLLEGSAVKPVFRKYN